MTLPPLQKVVGPLAVMAGVAGTGWTDTVTGADCGEAQFAALTACTVKVPDAVTVMDCVVAPFDQSQPSALLAVSTTLPPGQNDVGPLAVMAGAAGTGLTDTVTGADCGDAHPPALTACTVKVPGAVTVMDCVVAPLDQSQASALLAVSTTLPPAQNVVAPEAVMAGAGGVGSTVTVTGADAGDWQPFAFVTCTVKVPEALTVIDCEVAPLDQR